MTDVTLTQQRAAKVVGVAYLFAMAAAMFAEQYVRSGIVVTNDAVATARNIVAHEQLFRLGLACTLLVIVSDVALVTALFVLLRRVSEPLALFAAFVRLMETAVYATAALHYLDALRLLGTSPYLAALAPGEAAVLARLYVGSYGSGLNVAFIFLGIGSTVFCWLWYRSGYVPRPLAGLGVFASALLAGGSFSFVVMPSLQRVIYPGYMVPMFFFEVGMGAWLLTRGLRA